MPAKKKEKLKTVKKSVKKKNSISRTYIALKEKPKKSIGKIFLFAGPSGAGKTTIAEELLSKMDCFEKVITSTTRAPREGERQDIDYHFVSKEKFEGYLAKDEIMEYHFHYGYYYGSLKSDVKKVMDSGKNVLMVLDVHGALTIKEKYPSSVSFFIKTPSIEELKKRLIQRGKDSMEVIERRVSNAGEEMKLEDKFDHIVMNDNLDNAVKETIGIVLAELAK